MHGISPSNRLTVRMIDSTWPKKMKWKCERMPQLPHEKTLILKKILSFFSTFRRKIIRVWLKNQQNVNQFVGKACWPFHVTASLAPNGIFILLLSERDAYVWHPSERHTKAGIKSEHPSHLRPFLISNSIMHHMFWTEVPAFYAILFPKSSFPQQKKTKEKK